MDIPQYTDIFEYASGQIELADFSNWLSNYLSTDKFIKLSEKFIDIHKRLKSERDVETRNLS